MPPTNAPQTSFIPHDAVRARTASMPMGAMDLVVLASIVFLIASIMLAGAVFFYGRYLSTDITAEQAQLQRSKEEFQPSLIQEFTRLDDRMRVTSDLLSKHDAFSLLFQNLQQTTLKTVSFTSLALTVTPDQPITFKMDGIADSVNSIALQADLFSKSGVITNPIFSNINRELDGIHFSLTGDVNTSAINYSQVLSAGSGAGQPSQPAAGNTAPAAPQVSGTSTPTPSANGSNPFGTSPQTGASGGN